MLTIKIIEIDRQQPTGTIGPRPAVLASFWPSLIPYFSSKLLDRLGFCFLMHVVIGCRLPLYKIGSQELTQMFDWFVLIPKSFKRIFVSLAQSWSLVHHGWVWTKSESYSFLASIFFCVTHDLGLYPKVLICISETCINQNPPKTNAYAKIRLFHVPCGWLIYELV